MPQPPRASLPEARQLLPVYSARGSPLPQDFQESYSPSLQARARRSSLLIAAISLVLVCAISTYLLRSPGAIRQRAEKDAIGLAALRNGSNYTKAFQAQGTRIHWATHPDKCWSVFGMSLMLGAQLQLVNCRTQEIPHEDMRFIVPKAGETGQIAWASDGGYCLSAHDSDMHMEFGCCNLSAQKPLADQWLVDPDGQGHIHWARDTSRCLEVPDAISQEGRKLRLWQCREAAASGAIFKLLPEVQITIQWAVHPNKCLVIDQVNNGAEVQLWECSLSQAFNKFVVPLDGGSGPIVFAGDTRLCLDAASVAMSSKVWIWECNEKREQQWIFNSSGRGLIQSATDPTKCLEVPGSFGGQIDLYGDAAHNMQQQWQGVPIRLGGCDSMSVFRVQSALPRLIRWREHPAKCVAVEAPELGSHFHIRTCNTTVVNYDEMRFIAPLEGTTGIMAWSARRNLCLEASGGPLLTLSECKQSQQGDQQFFLSPDDKRIHLAMFPEKCIDVNEDPRAALVNELEVRECHDSSTFQSGPKDCEWNEWFMWSACSATCGFGTKRRYRDVKPETFAAGGKPCVGNRTDVEVCIKDPCRSGAFRWGDKPSHLVLFTLLFACIWHSDTNW